MGAEEDEKAIGDGRHEKRCVRIEIAVQFTTTTDTMCAFALAIVYK